MTIKNSISGYTKDSLKGHLQAYSGVYFVYIASHGDGQDAFKIERLLYIGEAADVKLRVLGHEKYPEWLSYLSEGEELCYATCEVVEEYRSRVEAAYIFKHKPPTNIENVHHFPFESLTIVSQGEVALLKPSFTL